MVFAKQLADEGLITDFESLFLLRKSKDCFMHLLETYRLTPIYIYMFDQVHACYLRTLERGRPSEQGLSPSQHMDLLSRYNSVFRTSRQFPYTVIFVNIRDFVVGQANLTSPLCEFVDMSAIVQYIDSQLDGMGIEIRNR